MAFRNSKNILVSAMTDKFHEFHNYHYRVKMWIGDSYVILENVFPSLEDAKYFHNWIKKQKGFKRVKLAIDKRETIERYYY